MTISSPTTPRPANPRAAGPHPAAGAAQAARTRRLLACGAVAGPLFVATAAAGLRHALPDGRGSRWAPRLLAITGAGLAGGGIFHPDPSGGYPPGTPPGASAVASWHGMLHQVCGSAAFLALIVFCIILARRQRAHRQPRMATCSLLAGVLCAAGVASGGMPHGTLTLFAGVSIALLWAAFTAASLGTTARPGAPASPGTAAGPASPAR
jgi:hypothetical protein